MWLALLGGVLLLSGNLVRLWQTPVAERAREETTAGARAMPPPPSIAPAAEEPPVERSAYREIVERPLFNRTRQPLSGQGTERSPNTPVAQQPASAPRLKLMGVVLANGQQLALLQPTQGRGKIRRFAPGSIIDGWRLKEIRPRQVVMTRAGREHELRLEAKSPPSPRTGESAGQPEAGKPSGETGAPLPGTAGSPPTGTTGANAR